MENFVGACVVKCLCTTTRADRNKLFGFAFDDSETEPRKFIPIHRRGRTHEVAPQALIEVLSRSNFFMQVSICRSITRIEHLFESHKTTYKSRKTKKKVNASCNIFPLWIDVT